MFIYYFWLCRVLVLACGIFSCSMWTLSCGVWDPVPWPGIQPGPLAVGVQSLLSHWTTREVRLRLLYTLPFSLMVQSLSRVQLFATPWTAACQAFLSITNSWSLFKLMYHLVLCHPLLLLPSSFPSIRVFSNESVLYIRLPKYWSFSFSTSLSNEYSGLFLLEMQIFLVKYQAPLYQAQPPTKT